ncbi:hypothetical protein GCM10010406_51690 [Streptomyces thermolineatus]|uniref:Outer membrane channel protein CpnT-like N-terminal domain-containing protein n=1 Tax=Streptomyces thermolineatus TaxID=44033 RepID=A0ABP6A349_9ACTN
MGAGQQAGDVLSRVNFTLDWSNPLASVLDEVVRGIIKQFNLDGLLEQVSGDNEKLTEVAGDWRKAARDMRGVVDDLVTERRTLLRSWSGESAKAFSDEMEKTEKALQGEADDMDTVAECLELAAAECAMAEQMMIELIVEILEAVLVAAAATAVLSLLTAGAAAAIGPLVTAAGVAHRAMKAARITAKLADKLSDLAKRMQLLRKTAKLRTEIRRLGSKGPNGYRHGLKKILRGEGDATDLAKYLAYRQAKKAVKGGMKEVLGVDPGGAVQSAVMEEAPKVVEEKAEYEARPPSQSFKDRVDGNPAAFKHKSVQEVFG